MPDYTRPPGIRLDFRGMSLRPVDALPAGKFPLAVNCRALARGGVGPRLPHGINLLQTALPALIHSLRRMDDGTGISPVFAFIIGSSTKLYLGLTSAVATQLATGLSGNRLSTVIFRPNQSVAPWCYVADSLKMFKVRSDGLTYNAGIEEPQNWCQASLTVTGSNGLAGQFGMYSIGGSPNIALFGAASSLTSPFVVNTTITGVLNPPVGRRGTFTPTPASATNIQANQVLTNGTSGLPILIGAAAGGGAFNAYAPLGTDVSGSSVVSYESSFSFAGAGTGGYNDSTGAGGTIQGRVIRSTDKVHLLVKVSDATKITNCVVTLWLDEAQQNSFTWTIAGGSFVTGTRQDLSVLVSALVRVGSIPTLSLATGVISVQVAFTVTGAVICSVQQVTVMGDYGPTGTTTPVTYFVKKRDSLTGAVSNPSPAMLVGVIPNGQSVQVQWLGPTAFEPQNYDTLDYYRTGGTLQQTVYIGSDPIPLIQSGVASNRFLDCFDDLTVANNPVMALDDYEPFPSIDIPRSGTVTINIQPSTGYAVMNWVSGDHFNTRWAPGTIVYINGHPYQLLNRPTSTVAALLSQTVDTGQVNLSGGPAPVPYAIPTPILLAQRLPNIWGPTDNAAFLFACGDPLRPGTLYFTKGNNPDSAPQTNSIEVTDPSEPLISGCIVNGLSLVFSGDRAWLAYPNFAQATATILGVVGSPFTTIETIAEYGLYCRSGLCTDGGANAYFISKEGIRKSIGGSGSVSITDEDLFDLFPHEGLTQQSVTVAGVLVSPPDYSLYDSMSLTFSQGYVYFDYIGLDTARHTLVYDTIFEAWSIDSYDAIATVHADNTGADIVQGSSSIPVGVLLGCSDGTIRVLSSTGSEPVAKMLLVTSGHDGDDSRAVKHFGDIYLEYQSPGGGTLDLWSDRLTVHQTAALSSSTLPVSASRVGKVLDLNSGLGVYALDLSLELLIPVNQPVGTVVFLWQPSLIPQPETIAERCTDWDAPNSGRVMFVQGCVIEADTFGQTKLLRLQAGDDLSLNVLNEPVLFNGRSRRAFSCPPFLAHTLRLAPQDTLPWRLYGVEYVYTPYPELCAQWQTENVSHGLQGWQHVWRINVPYISTAPLTLTLTPDTGNQVVVTLPSSATAQLKALVTLPPFKFKLLRYQFLSTSPFRLFLEDVEVQVKPWGDSGPYQIVKPFGGMTAARAEV